MSCADQEGGRAGQVGGIGRNQVRAWVLPFLVPALGPRRTLSTACGALGPIMKSPGSVWWLRNRFGSGCDQVSGKGKCE